MMHHSWRQGVGGNGDRQSQDSNNIAFTYLASEDACAPSVMCRDLEPAMRAFTPNCWTLRPYTRCAALALANSELCNLMGIWEARTCGQLACGVVFSPLLCPRDRCYSATVSDS